MSNSKLAFHFDFGCCHLTESGNSKSNYLADKNLIHRRKDPDISFEVSPVSARTKVNFHSCQVWSVEDVSSGHSLRNRSSKLEFSSEQEA